MNEELLNRISELYKPYKSEQTRLRELESQVKELTLRVRKLSDFCKLQAEMNNDLVQILKTNQL